MRIPRDVDGVELAESLEAFDYHYNAQRPDIVCLISKTRKEMEKCE